VLAALAMGKTADAFPSSRLVYARGVGAERCPEEPALRRAVAARLGYDPFFPSAERTIMVVIAAEGVDLKAKVYLVDTSGAVRGLREFTGPAERCGDLVYAAALSISIAIDPAQADAGSSPSVPPREDSGPAAPAPAPVPAVFPALPDRPEQPRKPTTTDAVREATQWIVGAGGVGAIGATPGATLGGAIYGSARFSRASFTLEARGDLPSSIDEPPYRFSSVGVNAVTCFHWDPFFSCLVGMASRFSASGLDPLAPAGQSGFFVGSGVRGGLEVPLFDKVWFRVHADALVSLLQVRVSSGGREIWRASPVSGSLGGALALHF
jgi:hypothetical protein